MPPRPSRRIRSDAAGGGAPPSGLTPPPLAAPVLPRPTPAGLAGCFRDASSGTGGDRDGPELKPPPPTP
eukprot:5343291-Prymnesium_polylepis.1